MTDDDEIVVHIEDDTGASAGGIDGTRSQKASERASYSQKRLDAAANNQAASGWLFDAGVAG